MHLIVGIDPGTTTGIAILNLDNGALIDLFSSKDLGLKNTILRITRTKAKVSLVATDVSHLPDFVSKVARSLGAKTFFPKDPLKVSDKISMTRKYDLKNTHERDALSAALNAYFSSKNKFSDMKLALTPEMKHLFLRGVNIKKIKELDEKKKEKLNEETEKKRRTIEKEKKIKREEEAKEKRLRETDFKKAFERERKKNDLLTDILKEKEKEITRLNLLSEKTKRIYPRKKSTEAEIIRRNRTIRNLKTLLLEKEKELISFERLNLVWGTISRKEVLPITVFPEISSFVFIRDGRKLKEGDIKKLKEGGATLVFSDDSKKRDALEENQITVKDASVVENLGERIYFVRKDFVLEKETKNTQKVKKTTLEDIVNGYRGERE